MTYQQPYPQQAPYGYPQQPPKKKRRWPFVLLGVGLVMAVGLVGCVALLGKAAKDIDSTTSGGTFEHPEDVAVTSCQRDATIGFPAAKVTVTNQSTETSTYAITVSFQSADGTVQHGEGAAFVARLEPGQRTEQTAQGAAQIPADAQVVCKVTSAKRTKAL